jgi:hypothetical protein
MGEGMAPLAAWKRRYLRLMGLPVPLGLAWDGMEEFQRRVLRTPLRRRGRVLLNVNIDDFAPYYASGGMIDLGGRIRNGLTAELKLLLDDFPALRLTLFVIPDLRLPRGPLMKELQAAILDPRNAEWVEHYRAWSQQGRVELAVHGLHHAQTENWLFQQHVEFAFKSANKAKEAIRNAIEIFSRAGLPITGFRAPGWGINSDLSLLGAIRESGFAYIAGSSLDGGLNECRQRVSDYYPTMITGVLNLPQNVLLDWSRAELLGAVERIIRAKGIVSIKGHTRWNGSPNQLSGAVLRKLRWLLAAIDDRYGDAIEYATLYQIATLVGEQVNERMAVGA